MNSDPGGAGPGDWTDRAESRTDAEGDVGTGRTDDGGRPGTTADHRILVVAGEGENRRTLVEFLEADGHEVVVRSPDEAVDALPGPGSGNREVRGGHTANGESSGPAGDVEFDLCVVDVEGATRAGDRITAVRQARHPTFVPCLLVGPERSAGDYEGAESAAFSSLDVTVDEVVELPIRERVLRRRVRTLLRTRKLSVELDERKEQYRRLLELTPEAILLVREGEVVFANEAGRALFTGERGAVELPGPGILEGRRVTDLFDPDDAGAVESLVDRVAVGNPPPEFVETRVVVDGEVAAEVKVTGVRVPHRGGQAVQLVVRDVTDRKRQQRRLRVYGRALDEASVGVSIADVTRPDDPLVYVNRSFEEVTGYDAPEILGRNCRFLQGEETDPETVAEIRAALEAEEPVSVTLRNYRKDGTPWWNELELTPVPDAEGEVTHYLGFQRDVTDRVEGERQLEALHATTRELMGAQTRLEVCDLAVETADEVLDIPATAVYLHDDATGELRPAAASDRTRDLFGGLPRFGPGEGIAREVYDSGEGLVVDDVRDHPSVYDPGTPIRSELFVPLGDHGVLLSGATETGAFDEGDVRFARTLAMNVEAALDRADREGELRERARELATRVRQQEVIADLGQAALRTDDVEALFEAVVREVGGTLDAPICEVLEYRSDEDDLLLRAGVGWQEGRVGTATFATGHDSQAGYTLLADDPVVVEDHATEDRFRIPDVLTEHGVESGISVVVGPPDDPWGVLGVHDTGPRAFTDEDANFVQSVATLLATAIDRRERERELEQFETIVGAAGEPIYMLDPDGRFVDVNHAMADLAGHEREELLGEHASTVLAEGDAERARALIEDLLCGNRDDATLELTVRRADGERRLCLVNIAVLPFEEEFRGTVGVLRDITERRRREQRMEVMDRILRHNLRNEMNVVRGRAELIRRATGGAVDDHVGEIVDAADSLLSLSEGVRRFHAAFDEEGPLVTVDLAELLPVLVGNYRQRFPGAVFETDLPPTARVTVHPELRIAVDELVENAVAHDDSDTPRVRVAVTAENGTVELAVADEGPGLPDFERRTFEGGVESALEHASGLGLWLVNWIVSSSGGEVVPEDNDPRGTVVRVRLPAADD